MKSEIEALIEKYNEGLCSAEEVVQIEKMIEQGSISVEDIKPLQEMHNKYLQVLTPEPSRAMSDKFYVSLSTHKDYESGKFNLREWFQNLWAQQPALRWAYSIVLVLIGVGVGNMIGIDTQPDRKLENLTEEVSEMKEMMMLTLLEKESTSERLRAVSLTQEMDEASATVTDALIKTLNSDDNINVRLAALEALYPYSDNPEVRQGLIASIVQQESPLVQMALAEMMVSLQEKRSIEELEQILKKETPEEVKNKIRESIKVLI